MLLDLLLVLKFCIDAPDYYNIIILDINSCPPSSRKELKEDKWIRRRVKDQWIWRRKMMEAGNVEMMHKKLFSKCEECEPGAHVG